MRPATATDERPSEVGHAPMGRPPAEPALRACSLSEDHPDRPNTDRPSRRRSAKGSPPHSKPLRISLSQGPGYNSKTPTACRILCLRRQRSALIIRNVTRPNTSLSMAAPSSGRSLSTGTVSPPRCGQDGSEGRRRTVISAFRTRPARTCGAWNARRPIKILGPYSDLDLFGAVEFRNSHAICRISDHGPLRDYICQVQEVRDAHRTILCRYPRECDEWDNCNAAGSPPSPHDWHTAKTAGP